MTCAYSCFSPFRREASASAGRDIYLERLAGECAPLESNHLPVSSLIAGRRLTWPRVPSPARLCLSACLSISARYTASWRAKKNRKANRTLRSYHIGLKNIHDSALRAESANTNVNGNTKRQRRKW